MQMLDYQNWKVNVLADIDASAHTTQKGDRFVQLILRGRYQLSEDDAVNATDVAGAGDRGVDAIYIEPAEDGTPPGHSQSKANTGQRATASPRTKSSASSPRGYNKL